jgi:hypothetical protein
VIGPNRKDAVLILSWSWKQKSEQLPYSIEDENKATARSLAAWDGRHIARKGVMGCGWGVSFKGTGLYVCLV